MIELRLVKHALALGRYRNFARAAESLRLTQPSLSRSIAALEHELGVRLFDRTKSGVRPTAFGEVLLQRGAALLAGEADFRREIQLLADLEAGTLAIGTGPYPPEISVGPAVARLLRAHPRLRVEVLCAAPDEIARGVLAGRFDVGIADPQAIPANPRLRAEPVAAHPVRLACRPGHPLAGRHDLALDDVLRYPMATTLLSASQGAAASRGPAAGRLDETGGVFVPAIHVNSLALARRIAQESDALFPATPSMLAQDLDAGTLVALDFQVPEMQTEYAILTLADRSLAPATAAFLDLLRAVEAEVVAREVAACAPRKSAPRSRSQKRPAAKGVADPPR